MSHLFRGSGYGNGWIDEFDVGDLVDFVNGELSRTGIYLSDADIRKFAGELEELASLEDFRFRGEKLTRRLTDHLEKDKDSINRAQGLYRSRHRFLIFCYVARHIRLKNLATVLLKFWTRNESDIVVREKHILLTEWCTALLQLRNVAPEQKWRNTFNQVASLGPPMFEEWRRHGQHRSTVEEILNLFHDLMPHDHGRGRHQLQPYDFPVRRLSVPARRPNLTELPPYPRTGYNSPLISPRHDNWHLLHLQQHMHAYELARLQRDVDDLRDRY